MVRRQKIDSLIGKKIKVERGAVLPHGRHTAPKVFSIGGRKYVFKVSSRGKGLSLPQASELAEGVKKYNTLLRQAGVRVSDVTLARAMPERGNANRYYVASLEKFINNRNASELIATSPKKRAIGVFKQVMEEVYKAVAHKPISRNKSGLLIDSKPKNYVLGKDGKMYYIDFYTPKLLDGSGKLHPYFPELHSRSRQELQTRFQDKRAIFQILLAHTVADRAELREEFEKELIDFLRSKGETRVVSYLQGVIKRDYRVTNLVKEKDLETIPRRNK